MRIIRRALHASSSRGTFDAGILAHELGHCFSLPHTHGPGVASGTDELVNGSNCEIAGDFICDTPADPNINGRVDSQCRFTATLYDANGDRYAPPTRNIMSYSRISCYTHFTPEQSDRMNWSLFNQRPELLGGLDGRLPDLRWSNVSFAQEVVSPGRNYPIQFYVLSKGCKGTEMPFDVTIYLSKDGTPDADDHVLKSMEIQAISAGSAPVHANTLVTIPEGLPDGRYQVLCVLDPENEIEEYNEDNNLIHFPVTLHIRGKIYYETLSTYPNPSTGSFTINVRDAARGAVQFRLLETSGRLVAAWEASKLEDQAHFPVTLDGVAEGMYFLEYVAGELRIVERIVVGGE